MVPPKDQESIKHELAYLGITKIQFTPTEVVVVHDFFSSFFTLDREAWIKRFIYENAPSVEQSNITWTCRTLYEQNRESIRRQQRSLN